jgi:hypothetical protein
MFGWTLHTNPYVPAWSAGTSYVRSPGPGKISPLKTSGPVGLPVWMATLCGVPWSSFLKWIWKGFPAGADSSAVSNATFMAASSRTVPPAAALAGADAGAEAGGAPLGAPEPAVLAIGVTDGAGA